MKMSCNAAALPIDLSEGANMGFKTGVSKLF